MSRNSDDEYVSADESDDKLLRPDASQGRTKPSGLQAANDATNAAQEDQQSEVVKVPDNKYVSDAESMKSGGVVELTEEQRKVSTSYIILCFNSVVS